ncbi:MAG: hypothetical protein R2792_00860 [Saprospiraceae bacterium]
MNFYRNTATVCLLIAMLAPSAAFSQKKAKKAKGITPEAIERLHAAEDTLAILAFAVVNDSIEQERFAACRVLITNLVQTLKVPNSFQYPFDRLRSISILAPPDSSFRIFTWQLFVNDSTYRYYGAIQMNQAELKLFPLIDRSFDMEYKPTNETHTADKWYGALYYNILPLKQGKETQYLLFGYDAFSFFDKRKVLEVLTFDEEGKPKFGSTVFNRKNPFEQRIILEYSAEASIRLNWDEQYQMILYDHLIPMASPFNRGITFVTDGSYEGFKVEKGKLVYVEKVFDQISDEVPMPEPILNDRKSNDLFGKKRNR